MRKSKIFVPATVVLILFGFYFLGGCLELFAEEYPGQQYNRVDKRGVVNGSRVNIRNGPSLESAIVSQVEKKGTFVEIVGEQSDWFYIRIGDAEGWVYASLVTVEADETSIEEIIVKEATDEKTHSMKSETIQTDTGEVIPVAQEAQPFEQEQPSAPESLESIKTRLGGVVEEPALLEIQVKMGIAPKGREPFRLRMKDYVQLVKRQNERIVIQELEWMISNEAVLNAKSIFEPLFGSNLRRERNNPKRSTEERLQTALTTPDTNRHENLGHVDAALESLLPSGAQVRLGYNMDSVDNIFTSDFFTEYRTFFGGNITQPLLKGFGIKTTMANIHITEADADIAFQSYRQQLMQIAADAAKTYLNLLAAQGVYQIRQGSVQIAKQILESTIARVKAGKIPEIDILDAEAGVSTRKALVNQAKQNLISAMSNAWTYISYSVAENARLLEGTEPLEIETSKPDIHVSLEEAFKLRPEYISTLRKIEREDIRVYYAKNQRWPQLDLKGSYGLNGIDDTVHTSFDDAMSLNNESWLVGLEFKIPILGGNKSRSELAAAKFRKRQALLELKSIEVALVNFVDATIKNVFNAFQQVELNNGVKVLRQGMLDAELARFNAGKSDSYMVLQKEEDLHRAKEAALESLVNYKNAILALEAAKGTLLQFFGIEVMEVTG
ncbi:TolC family protein [Thermodesulfobacteriota bacterium]